MAVSYKGGYPIEGLAFCVDFSNKRCFNGGVESQINNGSTVSGLSAMQALGISIRAEYIENSRPVFFGRSLDGKTKRIYNGGSAGYGWGSNYSNGSSTYSITFDYDLAKNNTTNFIEFPADGTSVFVTVSGNSFGDITDLSDNGECRSIFGHSKITELDGATDLVGPYRIGRSGPTQRQRKQAFATQNDKFYYEKESGWVSQNWEYFDDNYISPNGRPRNAYFRADLDGVGNSLSFGVTGSGQGSTAAKEEGDTFTGAGATWEIGPEVERDGTYRYHAIRPAETETTIPRPVRHWWEYTDYLAPVQPLPNATSKVLSLAANSQSPAAGTFSFRVDNGIEIFLNNADFPEIGGINTSEESEAFSVFVHYTDTGELLKWNVINPNGTSQSPDGKTKSSSGLVQGDSYTVIVIRGEGIEAGAVRAQRRPAYYEFDGSNDRMWVDELAYGNNVKRIDEGSIFAWIRTTFDNGATNWSNTNWSILDFDRSEVFTFTVNGGGQVHFSARTSNNGGIGGTYHDIIGNEKVNDGEWHLIGVTRSTANQRIRMWIDGYLDREFLANGNLGYMGRGSTRYGIIGDGSEASAPNGSGNNIYYDGDIAGIWLWDEKELDENEVLAFYKANAGRFKRA